MNLYLVSYDNGSRIPGARLAPYKLYEAINRSRLSSKVTDFKIHSINMYNDNALEAEKKISCIVEKNSFKKNELNLFVGGDHSITCFFAKSLSLKGLIPNDSFLVIFDAHFDGFCKTEFSRIKNYNFVETLSVYFQHIFIIGFRDYYPPVKNVPLKVTLISMEDIKNNHNIVNELIKEDLAEKNVYLSIDMDCIDPSQFPGVSYSIPGGIFLSELNLYLNILFEYSNVLFIDFVEYNPMIEEKQSLKVLNQLLNKVIYDFNS